MSLVEELRQVDPGGARPCTADLDGLLGIGDVLQGPHPGPAHEHTCRDALDRSADPGQFLRLDPNLRIAEGLRGHEPVVPDAEHRAVGLGPLLNVVRGYQAAGTGHVLHDETGVSRNVFAHVAHDLARVRVVPTARCVADDNPDGLALEEVIRGDDITCRQTKSRHESDR